MSFIQVIYTSEANESLAEPEVLDILRKAQFKNQAMRISGLLLYKDGRFMQLLEGEPSAVTALLEVIAKDPRHKNLVVTDEFPVDKPSMPTWAMGYFSPTADEAARKANLFVMSPEDVQSICSALPERIGSRFLAALQHG